MRILFLEHYSQWVPHFGTTLELIEQHVEQGDEVCLVCCNRSIPTCDVNADHGLRSCATCWIARRQGLATLSRRIALRWTPLVTPEMRREAATLRTRFATTDELKAYAIGNLDIGYAVLSSLVSRLRDPYPDLLRHEPAVNSLAVTTLYTYRTLLRHIDTFRPDRVYLANARLAPMRAAMRACEARGVSFVVHERGHDTHHYALFANTMLHDAAQWEANIRASWQSAEPTERERKGAAFFEARARGADQGWMSFVRDQDATQLPADWDPACRNVVIFLSSEDEYVAINPSWRYPFFRDQLEGLTGLIARLAVVIPPNMHLYLRAHPNMRAIVNPYARRFGKLTAPFLTFIPPESPVSTYRLIQAAEKVVSFGSTVGIESVYWGKASILCGPSLYAGLGGTYGPDSWQSLLDLVLDPALPPGDRGAALMYGHHLSTFGTPFRHYTPHGFFEGTFRGRTLGVPAWLHHLAHVADRARRVAGRLKRAR